MKRVAIIVSSQYGQTLKIAECLRSVLEEFDQCARLFLVNSDKEMSVIRLEEFDGVIVGGPVYLGSLPSVIQKWIRLHSEELNKIPVGFFTVSLNAADRRPEARNDDIRVIKDFLEHTGLKPVLTSSLIGAIHYRQYGFFEKWILRRVYRSLGGPTDTKRNHELTDWNTVKSFAHSFANIVEGAIPEVLVPNLD
jgi:menaquinone-dependent protoporphyrinogen oxidase